MLDTNFKTYCDDFEVEFAVGPLCDEAGITEENIDERETILDNYIDECNEELQRLTSHADNVDLLAGVCCGVAAGIIDAVTVGKWDFAKAKAISNKDVNLAVIDFAKKNPKYKDYLGKGKDGDRLDTALKFLEKEYHLPGDGAYQAKGWNMGIGGKDHRLADFCHHDSIVGLVSCIIVQFSEETIFFNPAGELFHVPIVVNEYGQLIGENTLAKVFSGIVNWFFTVAKTMANRKGHLMSDKATAQGIPGTFMSILKELSSLPCFKDKDFSDKLRKAYSNGIGSGNDQVDLGSFNALFSGASSKFDMRTEMAIGHELKRQSIPVLVNEMLVRSVYFIRRFIDEIKEKGAIDKVSWKRCIPINNRTIQRMVTVASGTFIAVDLTDAVIESALSSQGSQAKLAEGIILRINFVNIGRFTLGCAVDATSGFRKTEYEFMALELSTGKAAITAERFFLHAKKREDKFAEREVRLSTELGEIEIDQSRFSKEEAMLAAREIADKKVKDYDELKNRPWYKKLYSAITFQSDKKKLAMEDFKNIEQILTLFVQVQDSEVQMLNARMERVENALLRQHEQAPVLADPVSVPQAEKPEAKTETPKIKRQPKKESTLKPDINAKYGGTYKIISARDPDKALSIFQDKTFMGGINSMNKSLELVSKNNPNVTVWTIESCGQNIYRILDSVSGLVIEYNPSYTNKTMIFVKKWKETPACIWEIKGQRDGTVLLLSNADIEMVLKTHHGSKVVIGKALLKESKWILERM